MPTTYGDLVEEIIGGLQAYTVMPDQMTLLASSISPTDTTFKVEDIDQVSRGIAEIGDELVYIRSTDQAAQKVSTGLPWRGWRGTTATSHAAGELVTFAPTYPRSVVKREINNVLLSLYPSVYGVGKQEFTGTTNDPSVGLPATAQRILAVRYKTNSITGWMPVREYGATWSAPADYATGVTLDLYGAVNPGYQVQVLYGLEPTPLVNEDDLFTSTGLAERCKDIIVYGVQWRLAQNLDLARLPVVSAEADEEDANKQTGSAVQVANTFYKLHQAALTREQSVLNAQYPARQHKIR